MTSTLALKTQMVRNLMGQQLQLPHKNGLTSSKPLESLHFHKAYQIHTLVKMLLGSFNPAHLRHHEASILIHQVLSKAGLVSLIVTSSKSISQAEMTRSWANVSARGSQRADLPPCSDIDHPQSLNSPRSYPFSLKGYIAGGRSMSRWRM